MFPQCHVINYSYCLFLDGRLYLKTTVMYWIFPVEEIHVIVKNFAVRHSSLENSEKNKVLLRELPQFCVLMFFRSLSILQKRGFLLWFSPVVYTRDLEMFVNVQVSNFLKWITAILLLELAYRVKGRSVETLLCFF